MNKKEEFQFKCYRIAAICFYIASFMWFIGGNNLLGVADQCLGTVFLCLAVAASKKTITRKSKLLVCVNYYKYKI